MSRPLVSRVGDGNASNPKENVAPAPGIDHRTGLAIELNTAGFQVTPYMFRPWIDKEIDIHRPQHSGPSFLGSVMDDADAPFYSDSD